MLYTIQEAALELETEPGRLYQYRSRFPPPHPLHLYPTIKERPMRFTKEELKRWEAAVRDHGGKEMPTINPNKLYSLKEAASIMELSEAGFRQHVYYSKHSPFLKKNAQRRGGRLFFKSETLIKLAEKLGRI